MELDLSNISAVLGTLGVYFAVLLVLAVSVETLLEPLTWFKGLRKQASPDDVLKSVKEWLPEGSDEAAKVIAIQSFTSQTKTNIEELNTQVSDLRSKAEKALTEMGLEKQLKSAQKDVALQLATLREKYASTERNRITWLRVASALVGIVLAFILQINTFEILGSLFKNQIFDILSTPWGQYGGMLITGLAASAGSSFWHDMLGRVRNLKEGVQQVSQLQLVPSKEEK